MESSPSLSAACITEKKKQKDEPRSNGCSAYVTVRTRDSLFRAVTFHHFKVSSQFTKPEETKKSSNQFECERVQDCDRDVLRKNSHGYFRNLSFFSNLLCCWSLTTRVLTTTIASCSVSERRPLTCLTPVMF